MLKPSKKTGTNPSNNNKYRIWITFDLFNIVSKIEFSGMLTQVAEALFTESSFNQTSKMREWNFFFYMFW